MKVEGKKVRKDKGGTLDLRTKGGKVIAERMAKARAARGGSKAKFFLIVALFIAICAFAYIYFFR